MGPKDISSYMILASKDKKFLEKDFQIWNQFCFFFADEMWKAVYAYSSHIYVA